MTDAELRERVARRGYGFYVSMADAFECILFRASEVGVRSIECARRAGHDPVTIKVDAFADELLAELRQDLPATLGVDVELAA